MLHALRMTQAITVLRGILSHHKVEGCSFKGITTLPRLSFYMFLPQNYTFIFKFYFAMYFFINLVQQLAFLDTLCVDLAS